MKKLIVSSLIAASAVALSAGAASAQSWRGDDHGRYEDRGRWVSINERQDRLERRIDRGLQRGDLTRREAFRLRSEMNQVARLEHRYRMNGLSNWERADLDRRFDRIAAQIRWERNDGQYGSGYGYGR
jgi:Ni/Co efflux regulator RcnB